MTDGLLFGLTLFSALGCGLMGGVFFAFSSFVMKALGRLPAPKGIAAMQSMNVVAITPLFMTALFGTGAACAFLAVFTLLRPERQGAAYRLAGGILYIAGSVLVTIICNVPLNNALAGVDPESAEGSILWTKYLAVWTAWNHVRTAASLIAAAALIIGLAH